MKPKQSLEDACQLSAAYNFVNDIRPGLLIDMNDQVWRVAVVKSVADSAVDIRYEAWGPSCDEVKIPKTSARLAPFRSRSVGYTGQKCQAYRLFAYVKSDLDKYSAEVKTLVTNGFDCAPRSAAEFTQFFRGELFFYIDSLVTLFHYAQPDAESVHDIFSFLDSVMEAIVAWVQAFPLHSHIEEYNAAKKHPLLYLVDPGTAVAASYPELAAILRVCFGGDRIRVEKSFKYVDQLLTKEERKSEESIQWAVEQFYGMFKRHKGLETVLKMLTETNEKTGEYTYPARLVFAFLSALRILLGTIGDPDFATAFVPALNKAMLKRFSECRRPDFEEIDLIGEKPFFELADAFLVREKLSSFPIRQAKEKLSSGLWLEADSPHIKLKGLALLRARLQIPEILKQCQTEIVPQMADAVILTIKTVSELGLLEPVFVRHPCPELIHSFRDFLHVLVLAERMTQDVINTIWSCYLVNSQEVKQAVLELIADLAEYAPYSIVEQLLKLFKTVPAAEYTVGTIRFVATYMDNVDKNIARRKPEKTKRIAAAKKENERRVKSGKPPEDLPKEFFEENYDLYDYELLWSAITAKADSKLDLAVRSAASDCLINAVAKSAVLVENYLMQAISVITAGGESELEAMEFFEKACMHNRDRQYCKNSLKLINKGYRLFDVVFKQFMHYKSEVCAELVKDPKMAGTPAAMSKMFRPMYTHEECVKRYFGFLEFMIDCASGEIDFSQEQIAQLWTLFIVTPSCPEETRIFFQYLTKQRDLGDRKKQYTMITDATCAELFMTYFVKAESFQMQTVNGAAYECYRDTMVRYNVCKGNIKSEKDGKLAVSSYPLDGLNMLRNTALSAPDREVREQASQFLIDIHVSLFKEKKADLPRIARTFVHFVMAFLPKDRPDRLQVLDVLELIRRFIFQYYASAKRDRFENFGYEKINKAEYKGESYVIRKCTVKGSDGAAATELNLKIKETMNIYDFKREISYYLRKPLNRLRLLSAKKKILIDGSYDNLGIKDVRILHVLEQIGLDFMVEETKAQMPADQLPSYTLANYDDARNMLISCMRIDDGLANSVWKLIKEFPLNKGIVEKLLSLGFLPKKDAQPVAVWYAYLNVKEDIHELLCVFFHFKRLLVDGKGTVPIPADYFTAFFRKQGFEFLTYHYNLFSLTYSPSFTGLRVIKYLQQCITQFLQKILIDRELYAPDILSVSEVLVNALSFVDKHAELGEDKQWTPELRRCMRKAVKTGLNLVHVVGSTFTSQAVAVLEKDGCLSSTLNKCIEVHDIAVDFKRCKDAELVKLVCTTIWKHIQSLDSSREYCKFLLKVVLYRGLEDESSLSQLSPTYFELLHKLIDLVRTSEDVVDLAELNGRKQLDRLADVICHFERHPGVNFRGLLTVIEILYRKYKTKVDPSFTLKEPLLDTLLFFVFPYAKELTAEQARVSAEIEADQGIVKSALCTLKVLCVDNYEFTRKMTRLFSAYLTQYLRQANLAMDWCLYVQESALKGSLQKRFVGLENPANVCYMNSLMQQFFMNAMFTHGILEADCKPDARDTLLYQLKVMFATMREPSLGVYNATHLCPLITDFDGKPLSINEQKDVDEFFGLFLDRLEPFLKPAMQPELVREVFGGAFANEVIGLDCPHRSERVENFLSFSVQVKGKKNLEASLNALVEEENLAGKNAYDCDRCEKKTRAKRRTTFKVLPNHLVIVLKRFEYLLDAQYVRGVNIDFGRKKNKLNDYYEFPMDLDMEKYTEEYNCNRDIYEKQADPAASHVGSSIMLQSTISPSPKSAAPADAQSMTMPKEYYQYRLKGVVLHLGTVESGHYTSLICDHTWSSQEKWYEFNDGKVGEFRPERMAEEAYGGQEEGVEKLAVDNSHEMFTRIKNAYMLIYERRSLFRMDKLTQLSGELRTVQNVEELKAKVDAIRILAPENAPVQLSEDVQKQVQENIAKSKIRRTVLNMDFLQFVSEIILNYSPPTSIDYKLSKSVDLQHDLNQLKALSSELATYAPVLESWKFFTQFVLTVLLRVRDESSVPLYQVLKSLKLALGKDVGLSMWLVDTFCEEKVLEEFFLYCPSKFARFFAISLLTTACKTLYAAKEREKIQHIFEVPDAFQKSLSMGYLLKRGQLVETEGSGQIQLSARHHVPYIIILANNVMRMLPALSTWCPRRFRDLCLLLTLLARIGPEVRKVLLNSGLLSFALEKLLAAPGAFTSAISSILPITVQRETLALGTQKAFDMGAKGEARVSALPCKNKPKTLRFLVDLLAELMTECKLGATVPQYTSKVKGLFPHELSAEEAKFVAHCFEDQMNWGKLCLVSTSDLARESLARVFAHISFDNKEVSQAMLKFLCRRVIDSDVPDLPGYVLALRSVMKIKDKLEGERWPLFIKLFKEVMTQHIKESYVAYNYMADLFLELAYDSHHLYQAIQADPEKMGFVRKWLDYNSYPAPGYVCWVNTPNKKVEIKSGVDSADKAVCKEYSGLRAKILKQIEAALPCDGVPENIFIAERCTNRIQANYGTDKKAVDVRVNGEWVPGRVIDSVGEAVQVSFQPAEERMQSRWFRVYSECLASAACYSAGCAGKFYYRLRKYCAPSSVGANSNNNKH